MMLKTAIWCTADQQSRDLDLGPRGRESVGIHSIKTEIIFNAKSRLRLPVIKERYFSPPILENHSVHTPEILLISLICRTNVSKETCQGLKPQRVETWRDKRLEW